MRVINALFSLAVLTAAFAPAPVLAEAGSEGAVMMFTHHWLGYTTIAIFLFAYLLVILEEQIHLQKSKPLMVAAGLIWGLIAAVYASKGDEHTVEAAIRHNLLEYAELFLFLMAALTYVNTMGERGIFNAIRARVVSRGLSMRAVFCWAWNVEPPR